ncbi:MAG: septum formation initiator family protein [Deltaproteobacteria bacterium]|nr:septum formation initiator family protein [Deltaproteobacteria bacterium]
MARTARRRSTRPLARDSSRSRRRWPWLVLIFVVLTLAAASNGDQGLIRLFELRADYTRVLRQNDELEGDNARLETEVRQLRENSSAIEKIAREELGMLKADEIVYQVSP